MSKRKIENNNESNNSFPQLYIERIISEQGFKNKNDPKDWIVDIALIKGG